MFSFDNNQLDANQIFEIAKQQGISPLRVAINANGYSAARTFWDKVVDEKLTNEELLVHSRAVTMASKSKGVVGISKLLESVSISAKKIGIQIGRKALVDSILPKLEKANLVVLIGEKVFSNPNIVSVSKVEFTKEISDENFLLSQSADEVRKALKLYRYVKNLK